MSSKNAIKQASSIVLPTQEQTINARVQWLNLCQARQDYIQSLKDKNVTKSDYSDAMVAYDKQTQQQFNH